VQLSANTDLAGGRLTAEPENVNDRMDACHAHRTAGTRHAAGSWVLGAIPPVRATSGTARVRDEMRRQRRGIMSDHHVPALHAAGHIIQGCVTSAPGGISL
jgi:hypothetical protein